MTRVPAYYVTEPGCEWSYIRPDRCPIGGDPVCSDRRRTEAKECRHFVGVEQARIGKGPVTVLCSAPARKEGKK